MLVRKKNGEVPPYFTPKLALQGSLTTSHGDDDLQAIAIGDDCGAMLAFGYDLAVTFHCQTLAGKIELL